MNWTTDPPTKSGMYWFYGETRVSSLGPDFTDSTSISVVMQLVAATAIEGGMMLITKGNFMPSKVFHPPSHKEGHLGYWAKADIPEPPEDVNHLFTKETP